MSSGSEKRIRNNLISIRLTENEYHSVASLAQAAELANADYVRSVVLTKRPIRAFRRSSVDQILLAKALGELGKIGSNINQIAHVMNASGRDRPALLDRALTELSEVRDSLLRALNIRER
jgi:hypothetical protein